ncbi:hypothetical protein QMN58_25750, partial [Escherichia coli]|nr:hypothetical protein [Escherichia coli]
CRGVLLVWRNDVQRSSDLMYRELEVLTDQRASSLASRRASVDLTAVCNESKAICHPRHMTRAVRTSFQLLVDTQQA